MSAETLTVANRLRGMFDMAAPSEDALNRLSPAGFRLLREVHDMLIADRSTRPAEPAAPVAEAGDGEVVGWFCLDLVAGGVKGFTFSESLAKQRDGYRYLGQLAWEVYPVVRLSALEAERARADAAEQRAADALARVKELEFGAGFEAAFDAVVRPGSRYENWTPADDPAEIVTDLYNDLEDALVRAEKAAEDERDRLYQETMIAFNHSGHDESFRTAGIVLQRWGAMLPADRARLRASREAQAATDGGETDV